MKTHFQPLFCTILLLILLGGCRKEADLPGSELVGTWVHESTEDNGNMHFTSQNDFNEDLPGYRFSAKEKLTIRHNAGWCGTPPITYTNDDGKWEMPTDSTLHLEYPSWAGEEVNDLKIIVLSSQELVLRLP